MVLLQSFLKLKRCNYAFFQGFGTYHFSKYSSSSSVSCVPADEAENLFISWLNVDKTRGGDRRRNAAYARLPARGRKNEEVKRRLNIQRTPLECLASRSREEAMAASCTVEGNLWLDVKLYYWWGREILFQTFNTAHKNTTQKGSSHQEDIRS